jgi:ubiquinone/menaquinone biosynthesis C-methylase UbiE
MTPQSDSFTPDKARFDARATHWDENAERKARSLAVARAFGAIVDARGDRPDLLDYGCGTGQTSLPLADKCASVTGGDFSDGMLVKFMDNAASQGIANARTLCCNLAADPLPEARFDMVTCSMTLHHIADVPALVEKFARLLKPGGTLALVDLETEDGSFHDDNTGVAHYGFDKAQIVALLKAQGFADARARTLHMISKKRGDAVREYPAFLAQGTKSAT